MKEFISDLGVIASASGLMKIFCDNTGAIGNPYFRREPNTSRDATIPSTIKSRRETWRFARYI